MSQADKKSKDLASELEDHSAEGIEILTSEPSRLIRATIYLMFALLLTGFAWSFIGRADVIVKANGRLGPESEERRVYAPIDGEMVDVYMAEGMPVSEGDILARVNSPAAIEVATRALNAEMKFLDAQERYALFPAQKKAMENRLEAMMSQITSEEALHKKRVTESIAKLAEEQKLKLEKARAKLEKTKREQDLAKKVWEKHVRLFESPGGGGISRQKVEEKKNDYLSKRTEYQLAKTALGEFEIQMSREYQKRKEDINKKSENLRNLTIQHEELAVKLDQEKNRAETELKLARVAAEGTARVTFEDIDEDNFLQIRAPTSGVLTSVTLTQSGDKVEAKKPLAGIAPADTRVVLHVEILEKDRGFLKLGMPVKMKFNAFAYQRYGFINGVLEYISPNTVISRQLKKPVYKARISLDRDNFAVGTQTFPLRYGMIAIAEIVVRKRRLIDMALDPFRKVAG